MRGDAKVIEYLNKALGNELVAINQYFLHARMYKDWGLEKLGHKEYEESIDEMKHADQLIQRILFLEGLPNLQDLGKLKIGEHTREMLECDLKLEHEAVPLLRDAIEYCDSVKDFVSRDLFNSILESEEEHIDWLETQLGLIDKVGLGKLSAIADESRGRLTFLPTRHRSEKPWPELPGLCVSGARSMNVMPAGQPMTGRRAYRDADSVVII